MGEIKKPEEKTWYICWNDDRTKIVLFNYLNSNQVVTSPYDNMDSYTDESEWRKILTDYGYTDSEIDKEELELEDEFKNDI
tara:strand:- start:16106 stop:16348 length:243 start_codon:yes stop_codon:yes gene_type:complete